MAKTAKQTLVIKEPYNLTSLPVASGETIYQGTMVVVGADGLIYNLDSAAIPTARMIGFVADDSVNATGSAATTAAGSISGGAAEKSAVAGDKTVRDVYLGGKVLCTGAGLAQTSLYKTAYATDNYTINITGSGVALGQVCTYISATSAWVDINRSSKVDGIQVYRGLITAATTTAGGDAISFTLGQAAYIKDMIVDVTTPATGVATIDIGIAANGTTTSDVLFDGTDFGTAAIFSTALEQLIAATGNAAGPAKMTATQYITGTPSATLAGLVGTFVVEYIVA